MKRELTTQAEASMAGEEDEFPSDDKDWDYEDDG
jgi:hypothetical protein